MAEGKAVNMKELNIKLYGAERCIGTFPTTLHTDMRHLVEMLRRGKQPRLAVERVSALESALAGSEFATVAALRQQMEAWKQDGRRGFDADRYYDHERAAAYTEHNRGSQEGLARRALELAAVAVTRPAAEMKAGAEPLLAIDLGCGTGLSTRVLTGLPSYRAFAVAVDLSRDMLQCAAWDEEESRSNSVARVRCDLAQPLPFREGVFDLAYSIAAVHYLAEDSRTRQAHERLATFFTSLQQVCSASSPLPSVLQLFVIGEAPVVARAQEAASLAKWAVCELVCDATHSGNAAERDYLYLVRELPTGCLRKRPPRCLLYGHCDATCALGLDSWAHACGMKGPAIEASHRSWLEREHWRYAKRLVRLHARSKGDQPLNHAATTEVEDALRLAERLAKLLPAKDSNADEEDVDEEARTSELLQALHPERE